MKQIDSWSHHKHNFNWKFANRPTKKTKHNFLTTKTRKENYERWKNKLHIVVARDNKQKVGTRSQTVSHIWSLIGLLSIVIILAPNSTPMVRSCTGWKRLSVNCRRRHDLPTPAEQINGYIIIESRRQLMELKWNFSLSEALCCEREKNYIKASRLLGKKNQFDSSRSNKLIFLLNNHKLFQNHNRAVC